VAIGLHVHEAARVGVTLDVLLRAGIEGLRTIADLPVAVPISFWWICCHGAFVAFLLNSGFRLEADVLDDPRRHLLFIARLNDEQPDGGRPGNGGPSIQRLGKAESCPTPFFLEWIFTDLENMSTL
jgi:hypothetical protein